MNRISALESKYPDEADEYMVECIVSRFADKDLDLMECATKFREHGLTESEIDERMTEQGKFYDYRKTLDHCRWALSTHIDKYLVERYFNRETLQC